MSAQSISKILGGAMLVAGTCIGAGMLALPVSTAAAGFYPSTLAFVFCWFMMTLSAFLMLEASLWYPKETNLITMARSTLGKTGEAVAWCTYVLFLYALMTAYTAGASGIIAKGLHAVGIDESFAVVVLVVIFSTITYMGMRWVDWANRLLMVGLIGAYVALVAHVVPKVSPEMLATGDAKYLWTVGPLLVTSFGFHLTVPSLKNYLEGDVKALRIAILLGSLVPLIVYLLWEMLILGSVPVKGEQGLIAILQAEHTKGEQAVIALTRLLSQQLNSSGISFLASTFGLCAILTSFIGVSIGFFDFFADGFRIRKTSFGKFNLALLTFLPPVLFAIFYPRFFLFLHYAGIFAAVLLVIYPVLMVWSGRYRLNLSGYRMAGGKVVLLIILLFGLSVIGLEMLHRFDLLPHPLHAVDLFQ